MDDARPDPSPAQFERIRRVYLDVGGLAVADREDRLREEAAQDALVASTVAAMLAAEAAPEADRLDEPVVRVRELLSQLEAPRDVPLPERVGRYGVLGRLGHGVSGDVLRAVSDGPVEREVAIKVFRWAPASQSARTRFEREARALLRLRHPGIAQLLDAGMSDEGYPYLVFELLPGGSIDAACADVSIAERLRVMAEVCDAVQHAHLAGVIHRDLKPSNVIAATAPGEAAVKAKVIDFGVAKLLSDGLGTRLTLEGQAVGTLGFMSPEQLRGEHVDGSADIYSLGVLLAAVLTGEGPGDAGSRPEVAGLPVRFRRDAQAIVAKATSERPIDRYASAAHLADDLRRCVRGEPVQARRWSPAYASMRLLRRRPWTSAVAALGLAAIVTLGGMVAVSRQRLSRNLQDQRTMLAGTVVDMVAQLGQFSGTGEARLRLIDSLLERTESVLRQLPDDFDLRVARARLWSDRGVLMLERRDLAACAALREAASAELALLSAARPADVPLGRLHADSVIRRGDLAQERADLDSAYALYTQAAAIQARLLAQAPGDIGLLDDLCWSDDRLEWFIAERAGPAAQRELVLRRLERSEQLLAMDPGRELSLYNLQVANQRLTRLETLNGNLESAERSCQAMLSLGRELVMRSPHRVTIVLAHADGLSIAAHLRWVQGGLPEADSLLAQALELEARLGQENPTRADIVLRLARLWCTRSLLAAEAGDTGASIEHARRALHLAAEAAALGADPEHTEEGRAWLREAQRAAAGGGTP
jgi:tetratricopeptide (TPR) repeat protein